MVPRKRYLDKLLELTGKPVIKVITGMRRCGKSSVLMLLRRELIAKGVNPDQIIFINFESFTFSEIRDSGALYEYVRSQRKEEQHVYIMLDEIQEVKNWEKVVNAFLVDFQCDIYLTGANSHLLSSELATFLAGRYVEIHIHTLSFAEFLEFRKLSPEKTTVDRYGEFTRYLRRGGFPVLHTSEISDETADQIVTDIYSSAILRDAVQRFNIRDIELLERVVRFVFLNIGNRFSAKNISDFFKSQYRKVDINTVYNYLKALESTFLIYRIQRYDIRGKEILKTMEKYYTGDHGLLYATMGYRDTFISGVLENIVLMELLRRGYQVYTGKSEEREIDFIAEKKEEKIYVQVTFRMTDQSVIDREFQPLLEIRDHFPKYVVNADEIWRDNIQGIKCLHIADFLLLKEF